jgi:3',5'-cyclic AMP phosphodiesterase CpdA
MAEGGADMLIAQLTDLHIKKQGKLAYQKVDTLGRLRKAVDHINALQPLPDWVVITGDLADFGTPEEYNILLPELRRLKPTLKVIPGNHDHWVHLRSACQGLVTFDHPDYCHFSESFGDYQLIGIDTSVIGQPYGLVSDGTQHWLDDELNRSRACQVLLFMHHPPMTVGLSHMDAQKLRNDEALWTVVAKYPRVKGIITGHLHRPVYATWRGIPVWVGPSHSHSVSLDLRLDAPSSFCFEPGAIQLFKLTSDGIVSHISYIDQHEGPFPFFDAEHRLID